MSGNLTTLQAIAVATQFGITLAVSVGLGIFVGNAIDTRIGFTTIPVFTLVGVFVGLGSAIATTIQFMRALAKRKSQG